MQFPIQDHYIHTSKHRKATISSKWTFFCVCLYVCNDTEWETAYEQTPKTGLKQNISQGRESESFIMFSFWGDPMDFPFKNCGPCTLVIIHKYSCSGQHHSQYLSIEILNILYDRHGPNTGFWFLVTFEHLNSNTKDKTLTVL